MWIRPTLSLAILHLMIQGASCTPEFKYLPTITEQFFRRSPVDAHMASLLLQTPVSNLPPSSSPDIPTTPAPDPWAFLRKTDPPPPPSVPLAPNATLPLLTKRSADSDLDDDSSLDLPTHTRPPPAKRALSSGCFYVCPPTTKPNALGVSLTLLPSTSSFPRCAYILGLLGTCTYDPATGKLVGSGSGLTGQCMEMASTGCAAGSRSLTKRRQKMARKRDKEAEEKRPSRKMQALPEGLEERFGLWMKGRRGRLGDGTREAEAGRDRRGGDQSR